MARSPRMTPAPKPAPKKKPLDLDGLEKAIKVLFYGVEYRTFKHQFTPREMAARVLRELDPEK